MDVPQAMTDGCAQSEERWLKIAGGNAMDEKLARHDKSGSCAVMIAALDSTLYCANVGDSRAIMSADHGKKLYILSKDHKPDEDSER